MKVITKIVGERQRYQYSTTIGRGLKIHQKVPDKNECVGYTFRAIGKTYFIVQKELLAGYIQVKIANSDVTFPVTKAAFFKGTTRLGKSYIKGTDLYINQNVRLPVDKYKDVWKVYCIKLMSVHLINTKTQEKISGYVTEKYQLEWT